MKRLALVGVALIVLGLASTAMATGALSGKYKTVIKNDSALNGLLNGTWVIKFSNGKYAVTDNGHATVNGKFTTSGSKISLKDTGGPGKCPGTGKYKFKKTGSKLTFTKISDPAPACAGRAGVLTHGAFTQT